jgi:hypothetical protein
MKKLNTTVRLVLLLTPETMRALEELAKEQNKPASTYARALLVVVVNDQILNRERKERTE